MLYVPFDLSNMALSFSRRQTDLWIQPTPLRSERARARNCILLTVRCSFDEWTCLAGYAATVRDVRSCGIKFAPRLPSLSWLGDEISRLKQRASIRAGYRRPDVYKRCTTLHWKLFFPFPSSPHPSLLIGHHLLQPLLILTLSTALP